MPKLVVNGATLSCSCGTAPATLAVLELNKTAMDASPVATVDDHVAMVNIPAFGMCTTKANPQVEAATKSAGGTLTPQACVPITTSRWSPGSTIVKLHDVPLLTSDSKTPCQWTGSIAVQKPNSEVDLE